MTKVITWAMINELSGKTTIDKFNKYLDGRTVMYCECVKEGKGGDENCPKCLGKGFHPYKEDFLNYALTKDKRILTSMKRNGIG